MYDVIVIGAGVTGCRASPESLQGRKGRFLYWKRPVIFVREQARQTVVLSMRGMMPCREV